MSLPRTRRTSWVLFALVLTFGPTLTLAAIVGIAVAAVYWPLYTFVGVAVALAALVAWALPDGPDGPS